jgi:hypothetical protein
VKRLARLPRPLVLALAVACVAWTFGAPLVGGLLYRTPDHQPRGAAKFIFYCHLG